MRLEITDYRFVILIEIAVCKLLKTYSLMLPATAIGRSRSFLGVKVDCRYFIFF